MTLPVVWAILELSIIDVTHFIMNKTYYQNSFKFTVLERINQLPGNVVLRTDIKDMGGPRQISRSLRALVEIGKLIKLGCGAYAKAYYSKNLNRPIIKDGFELACKEALTKLGIRWEPGWAEKAYNSGESTQVPVRTVIRLKSRFRGHLVYGNRKPIFENNLNAR